MTADLVAFLRARLDEDEAVARAAFPAPWTRRDHVAGVHADDATQERPFGSAVADCRRVPGGFGYGTANADHIARHDPARVLAEVEAKRQIVDSYATTLQARESIRVRMREVIGTDADEFGRLYRQESELINKLDVLGPVLRSLALPCADHPDYPPQ
ncbi:DUF6221 family protein [Streptomyces sp. NPDC050315]|uniref:DUF6221 family protein n=1 Tax=Streptomyces sp. NPDC050315 TaxID=3155039 RepID=UPI0034219E3C